MRFRIFYHRQTTSKNVHNIQGIQHPPIYKIYIPTSPLSQSNPSPRILFPLPFPPNIYTFPPSHPSLISIYTQLNNTINLLRNEKAAKPKRQQPSRQAPEPRQIALVLLARHPDVHAPEAGDDVHGEDDGTEDGEFAEDVGGLLLALVHADVDLGEVVAVGAGEESRWVCVSGCKRWRGGGEEREGKGGLTFRNGRGFRSLLRCGLGYRLDTNRFHFEGQLPSARCSVLRSL